MGYSIGAVNGTALAFGRLARALEHWRAVDAFALRPRPRLAPFALCSPEPLMEFFADARDDAAARGSLRADLTVVTACPAEAAPLNARFTPGGSGGWDSPLPGHIAASCAVPLVFPPVDLLYRGRPVRLYDGGVPMAHPIDFSPLAGCATVLVLEMVTAGELGRRERWPWRELDQASREAGRGLVDEGLKLLARTPARAYRLAPSRRLEPMMLDFRRAGVRRMLAQGAEDARAFLAEPSAFYWKK